jgi:hypothetical protein
MPTFWRNALSQSSGLKNIIIIITVTVKTSNLTQLIHTYYEHCHFKIHHSFILMPITKNTFKHWNKTFQSYKLCMNMHVHGVPIIQVFTIHFPHIWGQFIEKLYVKISQTYEDHNRRQWISQQKQFPSHMQLPFSCSLSLGGNATGDKKL